MATHTLKKDRSSGRWLTRTVSAMALSLVVGAVNSQTAIVNELVTNGTFDSDLSGWLLETQVQLSTAWSAEGNVDPGSFRATQDEGGPPFTTEDLGSQCIPVEAGNTYQLRSSVKPRDDNEVTGYPSVFVAWPMEGCSASEEASEYPGHAHNYPRDIEGWVSAQTRFEIPAGVSEVRLALSVTALQSALGTKRYGAFFDDISFGLVRPDLVADIDFMGQTTFAASQVTFDVGISNKEMVGTATSVSGIIDSSGLLRMVSETCPGDMVNSTVNNQRQISWFNIPDMAPGDDISCTVTADVEPGFSGLLDSRLTVDCADCDLRSADNSATDTLEIGPRADIAASISAQAYQSIERTLRIAIELENLGTKTWDEVVLINKPTGATVTPGTCSGSPITVEDANFLSFPLTVQPGQSRGCSIGFDYSTPGQQLSFGVSGNSPPSVDYDSSNNSASTMINAISLRVNTTDDRNDLNPGDGICDSSVLAGFTCSLRAAVQEANALPGFQFIPLPIDAAGYGLDLPGGDQHIEITDTVEIATDPANVRARIFADWTTPSDRSRIFMIHSPQGEVDLRSLHLQGQDFLIQGEGGLIKSTDTLLDLSKVTLEDGGANFAGGALYSNRRVLMERVIVRSNRAPFGAGVAFFSDDPSELFTVKQSRIHDNVNPPMTSQSQGGGIYVSGAQLELYQSAVDNNFSVRGAGIALVDGSYASIENTTISTNSASAEGGAVWLQGSDADINFSTVAENAADRGNDASGEGGALYITPGSLVTVGNSIFYNNQAQASGLFPLGSTCFGSMTSNGYNTFQPSVNFDSACSTTAGPNDNNGQPPSLSALGPTGEFDVPYHELLAEGQDIDQAAPECERIDGSSLTLDQRSQSRPLDGNGDTTFSCDRGAVESDGGFPGLALTCPSQVTVEAESFSTINCSVESINGAAGDVFFSCLGTPPSCDFVPEPLALSADGVGDVDVIVYGNAQQSPKIITVFATLSPAIVSTDIDVVTNGIIPPPEIITVNASVTGNGAIVSSPEGLDCGSTCIADFATSLGTVALTATPSSGWEFSHWTGSCNGQSTPLAGGGSRCTLATSADHTTAAVFTESTTATVTVSLVGSGMVTSSPSGIQCPSDCSWDFDIAGGNVTLTATPDAGWEFVGWSGACSGAANCTVSVSQDQAVTAQFTFLNQAADLIIKTGFE